MDRLMESGGAPRLLGFTLGPCSLSLSVDDGEAAHWLTESLYPWFADTEPGGADWAVEIRVSEPEFTVLAESLPAEAPRRACFAFDQFVFFLPGREEGGRTCLADKARACVLIVEPGRVKLVARPGARRWRMTVLWLILELAATALRCSHLDLHAAGVEHNGRAVVIAGPKESGKTTLMLHLLASGRCGWIANDRLMIGGEPGVVRGMPAPARFRASTVDEFPGLFRDIPAVPRPYLYSLNELAHARPGEEDDETDIVALSTAQFCRQMKVAPVSWALPGAFLFPRITKDFEGWAAEPLAPDEVNTALRANLYGRTAQARPATAFEQLCSGIADTTRAELARLAVEVPSYRLVLGPDAYARPGFAAELLHAILPR